MEKRYRVTLVEEERQELQSMVSAGKAEAHLVATACGAPPEGRARWTLRRLADRGGTTFALYLVMIIASLILGWREQLAVGACLAIGGGLVFALGIGLSVYREKLLQLPEKMAKREGLFRVLNWR